MYGTASAGSNWLLLELSGAWGPSTFLQSPAIIDPELGRTVAADDLRRGDLVLWLHPTGGPGWTGHSAIAMDADTVIHASGRAGEVCRQPLAEVDANQRAEGFDALIFRRL